MLSVPFANKLEIVSKLVDIVLAETLFAVIILVLSVPFANKLEIVSKLVEIVVAEILLAVIKLVLIVLTDRVPPNVIKPEPTIKLFVEIELVEILLAPRKFVLIVLALIFTVVTPPVGENPPAKFRVCAQIVVVDTVNDCILLVKTEDVYTLANVSKPPSLIIVYQFVPLAKKAIAP